MATLLITHDLGVVAQAADRIAVMYNGLIMEQGAVTTIFANPVHPYTQGLLGCIPRLGEKKKRLAVIEGPPPGSLDPSAPRSFLDNCPERFAPQLVYARGYRDLQPTGIGVNCRLCERPNCPSRAAPGGEARRGGRSDQG